MLFPEKSSHKAVRLMGLAGLLHEEGNGRCAWK